MGRGGGREEGGRGGCFGEEFGGEESELGGAEVGDVHFLVFSSEDN